jgi:hypothetical protein
MKVKKRNHRAKGLDTPEAKIARASGSFLKTPLTTNQVRCLIALKKWRKQLPMTRLDLLEACYGSRDNGLYSKKWLDHLWALKERRYIKIEAQDKYTDKVKRGRKSHMHTITELGIEVLEKAEAAVES